MTLMRGLCYYTSVTAGSDVFETRVLYQDTLRRVQLSRSRFSYGKVYDLLALSREFGLISFLLSSVSCRMQN